MGLKEVSFIVDNLSIGLNSKCQVTNIMVTVKGLSATGKTTRVVNYNLSSDFSKRWKSSFQDKVDELISLKLQGIDILH